MSVSDFAVYTGYFLGILIVFTASKIFSTPFKILGKLILNSVVGCLLLFGVNFFFSKYGIHVGINPLTAVFMGILGIPGAVVLILLSLIL